MPFSMLRYLISIIKYVAYDFLALLRLSHMTLVAYDICHLILFVAYDVCRHIPSSHIRFLGVPLMSFVSMSEMFTV